MNNLNIKILSLAVWANENKNLKNLNNIVLEKVKVLKEFKNFKIEYNINLKGEVTPYITAVFVSNQQYSVMPYFYGFNN